MKLSSKSTIKWVLTMIKIFWENISGYFSDPYAVRETTRTQDFSSAIRWSSLSKVGRSWAVRVTIFAPFLGSYLLFNDYIQNYFKMAGFFLKKIDHSGELTSASYLVINSYYLYFGLFLLGAGSILFSLFCPDDIKRQPELLAYAKETDLTASPVIAKSNFQFVLDGFFEAIGDAGDEYEVNTTGYPPEIDGDFNNLISEMYMKCEHLDDEEDVPNEDQPSLTDQDEEDYNSEMEFYTMSGYPNIYNIAHAVWSNPKVIWVFTVPFRALAPEFAKDIAFVKFKMLDHQGFAVRALIFCLYSLGFVLLAIPSLTTFLRLVVGLITS